MKYSKSNHKDDTAKDRISQGPVSVNQDQANQLLKIQKDILEIVASTGQYQSALDNLCLAAQGLLSNSVASVMLYDSVDKTLNVRAAPSLSNEAISLLNGLIPGEKAGSCGTAVFKGEPQYICNTLEDDRWCELRDFAKQFEVGACWSMPIKDRAGEVIGSFALSSFEHREPAEYHCLILETASKLASIIVLREQEERRLLDAASIDMLTGLANRTTLYEKLNLAIERCNRHDRQLAVMFIDLDNFKQVNDQLGHEVGDMLLKTVAEAMSETIRSNDSLGRLGGDEFILVVEEYSRLSEIEFIADKIIDAVQSVKFSAFNKSSFTEKISVSIGISLFPHDANEVEKLILLADKAMYEAKRRGKNNYRFYQESISCRQHAANKSSDELNRAVDTGCISAYLQPVFNLKTGELVSAEILSRWFHPNEGLISPEVFVPQLEKLGLLNQVTEQIIEEAIIQSIQSWPKQIGKILISVNMKLAQLNPSMVDRLGRILNKYDYPCDAFAIEIDESETLDMSPVGREGLRLIEKLGVHLILDKFGKGKTELASLNQLPISAIKIDRSIIGAISMQANDKCCTKNIIDVGLSIGAQVFASGVENDIQAEYLRKNQCMSAQGFGLGVPVASSHFSQYLQAS